MDNHGKRSTSFSLLGALALALTLGVGCAEEIVAHQQVEREANRIVFLLRTEGAIPDANKVRDLEARELRFNVVVPADRAGDALRLLEAKNLPEERMADTKQIFEDGSMIPTNQQERAKREVGVQGDLINELRKVPRVVEVSAVVSIPEDDPLRDINEARPRPEAAIIVQYQPDKSGKPPLSVEELQAFVQARLPEMRGNEVSVLLVPTVETMAADGQGGTAAAGLGGAPLLNPDRACEKSRVIGIEVCEGNGRKVLNVIVGAVIVAGILAAMAIFAVLRAMRYRKDLTRLTAQFERVKGSGGR
ncbi:MAG: hypothetical protein H6729_14910 [Deltaproteobacteria bacterium]|nr:hypothetical protein [Deltaproteobacteria bacterium]